MRDVARIVPADPHQPLTDAMWQELAERYPDSWMREVTKAVLITRDLDACEALLRGESVPAERIDWDQARRFGRR